MALLSEKTNHCANRVIRALAFLKDKLEKGVPIEDLERFHMKIIPFGVFCSMGGR